MQIIDDAINRANDRAMTLENKIGYGLADREDIIRWLKDHKGKRVFSVSW